MVLLMLVVHCGIPNTSKLVNFVVSIDLQNIAKATELTYQLGLSTMVQCFSLTTNQRTILFSLAF
jgi:hypothetical protein